MQRAGYTEDQELERMYKNMLPECHLFTRRKGFDMLAEFDAVGRELRSRTKPWRLEANHPSEGLATAPIPKTYVASLPTNPQLLFCWECAVECCRKPESGNENGPQAVEDRWRNPENSPNQ